MTGTVVIGAEGTSSSRDALMWAAEYAVENGMVLDLVHATGFPSMALELYDDAVRQGAEHLLDAERSRAASAFPELETRMSVDHRGPATALIERSEKADLVVVGSHRLGAFERMFSGSLSYQVAAAAHCPVAVVPRAAGPAAHGVVVGCDGSEDSLAAIAFAADEAQRVGEDLTVVLAWQEPAMYTSADYFAADIAGSIQEQSRLVLAESVAGLATTHPDLVVHRRLERGQPAAILVEAGATARLVVVGSRGRTGIARVLLGSVSHTVLLNATGPVVVVRAGE